MKRKRSDNDSLHISKKRKVNDSNDDFIVIEEDSTHASDSPHAKVQSHNDSKLTTSLHLRDKINDFFTGQSFYLNHVDGSHSFDHTISLTDIIKDNAKSAILVSFHADVAWLFDEIPILQTIPVWLCHSDKYRKEENESYRSIFKKLHINIPSLPLPYGSCHGKIILIRYKDKMRVAISTANLIEMDYHFKSQGIWIQDFPKRDDSDEEVLNDKEKDFKDTLSDYLIKLGIKDISFFEEFSWKNIKVELIASVPGYHEGKNVNKYGLGKLRRVMHDKKFDNKLLIQCSSVGSLDKKWVNETFYQSFGGKGDYADSCVKFVWPTVQFVEQSLQGFDSGSSLCFFSKNYKSFMKNIKTKFFSKFTNIPSQLNAAPHIKTYIPEPVDDNIPWAILTSANLSKAAWGLMTKNNKLQIRNYEIGVVFSHEMFNCVDDKHEKYIPIPYKIPLKMYEKDDEPWIVDGLVTID